MTTWSDALSHNEKAIETWEIQELLALLVDKSLIVPDGPDRWRILETVRDYGRNVLTDRNESSAARSRHLHYFKVLSDKARSHFNGPEQQKWMEQLDTEHDNIRAALDWSQAEEVEAGLTLAGSIWMFWFVRGYHAEGRAQLANAMTALNPNRCVDERGRAANGAGVLASIQGDYDAARPLFEECAAISRQTGDRKALATALNNLAAVEMEQGRYSSARTLQEEGLAITRELNDLRGIALALGNLGLIALDKGDFVTARMNFEESLSLCRSVGDRRSVSTALTNLGAVACDEGDFSTGCKLYEESLAISEELGDRWSIGTSLLNLGIATCFQGDHLTATRLLRESLTILGELGDRRNIASSLEGIAAVSAALGNPTEAATLWGTAERLREEIGAPMSQIERSQYEKVASAARTALNDDLAFKAAWSEGRDMTLEQAIVLALDSGG
jgi:tetratricopeptide (TPR) repeat protein